MISNSIGVSGIRKKNSASCCVKLINQYIISTDITSWWLSLCNQCINSLLISRLKPWRVLTQLRQKRPSTPVVDSPVTQKEAAINMFLLLSSSHSDSGNKAIVVRNAAKTEAKFLIRFEESRCGYNSKGAEPVTYCNGSFCWRGITSRHRCAVSQ